MNWNVKGSLFKCSSLKLVEHSVFEDVLPVYFVGCWKQVLDGWIVLKNALAAFETGIRSPRNVSYPQRFNWPGIFRSLLGFTGKI